MVVLEEGELMVGRFKTFLMLANVSRMIWVPLPYSRAIHPFHPIEFVLGEADGQGPPRHLVHLPLTQLSTLNTKLSTLNTKNFGFAFNDIRSSTELII